MEMTMGCRHCPHLRSTSDVQLEGLSEGEHTVVRRVAMLQRMRASRERDTHQKPHTEGTPQGYFTTWKAQSIKFQRLIQT